MAAYSNNEKTKILKGARRVKEEELARAKRNSVGDTTTFHVQLWFEKLDDRLDEIALCIEAKKTGIAIRKYTYSRADISGMFDKAKTVFRKIQSDIMNWISRGKFNDDEFDVYFRRRRSFMRKMLALRKKLYERKPDLFEWISGMFEDMKKLANDAIPTLAKVLKMIGKDLLPPMVARGIKQITKE